MRLALGLAVAAALVPHSASAQTPRAYPYREVAGQTLRAHVFRPESAKPAAGILLFHGGGWSAGEPAWTFDAARRFADWGLVAIAVQISARRSRRYFQPPGRGERRSSSSTRARPAAGIFCPGFSRRSRGATRSR